MAQSPNHPPTTPQKSKPAHASKTLWVNGIFLAYTCLMAILSFLTASTEFNELMAENPDAVKWMIVVHGALLAVFNILTRFFTNKGIQVPRLYKGEP